ncbi:Mut7-C RNAse domain-containing protein [Mycobacterium sp.]|uniref:Mut7-C RNAse domain-containing protein n=1 Tax=Mycobacterium sp. TaxID=1785 RepID=UPI002CC6A357|nr:Mut7-C RNAse domain-containing protein [Mycobacterium sp.]HTQ20759.1 Mut7-C RNAse domain-containing protein [Mycobacterium sp.]
MSEPGGYVEVRAYAELNDFVDPRSRGLTVRRSFRSHQTVKDVLEAMGIPHTEVDLILVNGEPAAFEHRPTAGDRIAAYPMFEALDIGSTARLRPAPLRDPRFVVDVNLGRLARLLRVLGLDVWWSSDADDPTLAEISLIQQRILLTRDRGLLKRRAITHGLFVHSQHAEQQTLEVIRRLDLGQRLAPFTRCLRCNGKLAAVSKDEVVDRLEPLTRRYYQDFSRCSGCGRIYWAGSHHARLVGLVERLRAQL